MCCSSHFTLFAGRYLCLCSEGTSLCSCGSLSREWQIYLNIQIFWSQNLSNHTPLFFNQVPIHEKRRFSNLPWPTLLLTLSGRPAALSPEQERFPILSRSSSPWSCPWCGPRLLCFPPCHESPFHVKGILHQKIFYGLNLIFWGVV